MTDRELIKALREERDEQDEHNARMDHILTRTANALHGGYAPPDCLHSWHDLPELVEKLRKERDEARRMYCHAIWLQGGLPPLNVAQDKGWDCFERKST